MSAPTPARRFAHATCSQCRGPIAESVIQGRHPDGSIRWVHLSDEDWVADIHQAAPAPGTVWESGDDARGGDAD